MVLHHFAYTVEMCDCRLCLYYNRKKKCTVSQCPCIEERIVAGAAGRSEVMTETMKDIHNAAFRKRLIQFIRESEELPMNFRNEKHRLAFDEAIRKLNKKNFALMSALYLLTAEHNSYQPNGVWKPTVDGSSAGSSAASRKNSPTPKPKSSLTGSADRIRTATESTSSSSRLTPRTAICTSPSGTAATTIPS